MFAFNSAIILSERSSKSHFDPKLSRTNLLILTCIFASIFFWLATSNGYEEASMQYLSFSTDNLLQGRVWTPITALFLHANVEHLLGNMIFLFVFGNTLEKELGTTKTVSAFFIGGVFSFLIGIPFYSAATYLIGASAAIFTLTAIALLVKPLKFSFLLLMPLGLVAIIYFVYNILAVYTNAGGNVAYVSHIIGFAIGIPFGAAWSKNLLKNILVSIGLFIIYLIIAYLVLPLLLPGS